MLSQDQPPTGVVRIRANNASPLTLEGTNTYVVAGWVIDPGPEEPDHIEAVAAAEPEIQGIVLTHLHEDHAGAARALSKRLGLRAFLPREGQPAGPFRVVSTPGHTPDHVCLVYRDTCFTGDTVLGRGSVFIPPGEGSLSAHLKSLERLRRLELRTLCPGHGPIVTDAPNKLDEYIFHRLEREQKLVRALAGGTRDLDKLLDEAWADVPSALRPAAALTLRAHLEKLSDEGRLPDDIHPADLNFG